MTRKSERELERAVEALDGGDGFDSPMTVRFIERRVDEHGDVVDESERVVEHEHCGPDLTIHETVVPSGWEPDP